MAFEEVKFEFPHESKDRGEEIELEGSSAKPVFDNDSDFEIEVEDDTPPEDRDRVPSEPPSDVTDEELSQYSQSVQNRIKHFAKGYHDERRAKEEALRERQALEAFAKRIYDENQKLKGDVGKSRKAIIEQAKRQVDIDIQTAKNAYLKAYEAGESAKLLEAEESLAQARAKKAKLDNIKLDTLQAPPSGVQGGQPSQTASVPKQPAPPPVARDERAESWAKANPWFGKDDEMTSTALGMHQRLVKEGVDPKSDTYYQAIDSGMRQRFPEKFGDSGNRQAANVVAPATRSKAPKKVKLTKSQVAIAKRLGVPLDMYAKQVAEEMRKAN